MELLSKRNIRYIQFEYGKSWKTAGATLKAAIDYLSGYGYKVWAIVPTGLKEFEVDFYGEYFEDSNFFAANQTPKPGVTLNESPFSAFQ